MLCTSGIYQGEHEAVAYTLCEGVALPTRLLTRLHGLLRETRWPAVADRSGVSTEEYLVLRRELNTHGEPYTELKEACEEAMCWADPSFQYDHLAITKNFVSSPHIDKCDQSYQYAVALGDFSGGGELCVEGMDGKARWMIDTRGRLAKFDGRSVHWVRGYQGERYSVVWYVNRAEHGTTQVFDVDLDWKPCVNAVVS